MTVQEYQARRIETAARTLAHFIATTAPDKLDWRPEIEGSAPTRSALEQAAECVLVNRYIAAGLRGETPTPPRQGPPLSFSSGEEAQRQLIESGEELAAAVRALPDEALTRTYSLTRGEFPGEVVMDIGCRNMVYHGGQVNLIQLLAGDPEFHVPPA